MTADRFWFVSSNKMTVAVRTTDELIIVETPPIVRKFTGQYLSNLLQWMEKQGGFTYYEITLNTADTTLAAKEGESE